MASIIRTCSSCGRANRVKAAEVAKNIRCGACKTVLGPVAYPIDADIELFDEVIHSVDVPVLVDFWAEWCGPCRLAAPEVARLAREMAGRAVVLKVDTEKHRSLTARYNIRGIPNFIVFNRGSVVMQQAGVMRADQMKSWLDSVAAAASRT